MTDGCISRHVPPSLHQGGIIAEAKSYIDSHILLAPGRYRDLQLEHMVSREQFPAWYRQYKKRLHDRAEAEHRDMVDRYRHRRDITYGEARDMLAASAYSST
ncbi:hypothetical protein KUBF_10620 [Bacteroides finegoldii]|nr:hypothetical protein KUBF_10620 [Bacteroides finegoldii]